MKKLTAAGMHWDQVKDEFDMAVDEVMKVAGRLGLSEERVRKILKPMEGEKDSPGFRGKDAGEYIKEALERLGL